jgi:hypothetical protein
MASPSVSPNLVASVDERRALSAVTGGGQLLFTAHRVEFDQWDKCTCGAPVRVMSERALIAGEALPQWVVVSRVCTAGC